MLPARRRLVLALGSLAIFPGCASTRGSESSLAGTVWLGELRPSSEAQLARNLARARYRLLGEVHDNPEHHAIRARLVDALGRSGLKPAIAFEQFDAVHDASLQSLLKTRKVITSEDVARAVQFDREGWNWEFYRPIVEAALRHRMPLRAANLSRAETMRIAKEGSTSLPPWPAEREAQLRRIIFEGHCGALPQRAIPNMVAAQRARDAQLAEALRRPAKDGVVLIAGNGHVRSDIGVPYYLPREGVLNVGLVEVEPGKTRPQDYGPLPFDYAWFTARTERPDPCEAFRKK